MLGDLVNIFCSGDVVNLLYTDEYNYVISR